MNPLLKLPARAAFFFLNLFFRSYFWMIHRRENLFFAKIKNILLIKLDRVGDVILATPLIEGLKRRFPKAKLTVLVSPQAVEVLS